TETTTTTTETTMETTTTTPMTTTPNVTITSSNGTQPPPPTAFPSTSNTTSFQPNNATANSTMVPTPVSAATPYTNTTTNSSSLVPTFSTNSSTAVPTHRTTVTAPTVAPGSSAGPSPSRATAVQLLRSIPLSFRILNRSFNESLRDPVSEQYQNLSRAVLAMVSGAAPCRAPGAGHDLGTNSSPMGSQGSVAVQSTLVFGRGNAVISSTAAEQQLRNSVDQEGFIMDLQLDDIRSNMEEMSSAPVPVVPDWAIALLVLVCILLLLSILTCLLLVSPHPHPSCRRVPVPIPVPSAPQPHPCPPQTICACRRKTRGKLDLFSTKDSYHPMSEYLQYQSHGRYVSPSSKPNPYSQVAGSNGAGTGTFTYTNPSATSDNL
ncbi:MUC1 protein, partial [Eolophus roseicapillus]|nr:MUC1 protein [Eolophus roseicapilla]